jgi:8-oxo-dGTP pyrophosphatase MutT (NUDIX family)
MEINIELEKLIKEYLAKSIKTKCTCGCNKCVKKSDSKLVNDFINEHKQLALETETALINKDTSDVLDSNIDIVKNYFNWRKSQKGDSDGWKKLADYIDSLKTKETLTPEDTEFIKRYTKKAGKDFSKLSEEAKSKTIGAGILCVAEDTKKFLVVKRAEGGDQPNTWCGAGGKVEPEDKDLKATALREFEEECGYDLSKAKIKKIYIHSSPELEFTNYIAVTPNEFEPNLDTTENTEHKWLTKQELLDLEDKHFGLEEVLDKLFGLNEIKINNPTSRLTGDQLKQKIITSPVLDIKIGKYDVAKGRKGFNVPFDSKFVSTPTKNRVKKVLDKLGIKPEKTWLGWMVNGDKVDSYPSTIVLSHYGSEPILIAQTQTSDPRAGQIYIYSQYFKSGKALRLPADRENGGYGDYVWQDSSNLYADTNATKEEILSALKIKDTTEIKETETKPLVKPEVKPETKPKRRTLSPPEHAPETKPKAKLTEEEMINKIAQRFKELSND